MKYDSFAVELYTIKTLYVKQAADSERELGCFSTILGYCFLVKKNSTPHVFFNKLKKNWCLKNVMLFFFIKNIINYSIKNFT